jgi:hypothetical protein
MGNVTDAKSYVANRKNRNLTSIDEITEIMSNAITFENDLQAHKVKIIF